MTDADAELWIPTLNAERTLHGTLAAARTLSPAPKRIALVDGGSTDATYDIAAEYDVPVIHQGSPSGLSAARNAALERCEAPLLAMIDADVQPAPDWLGTLAKALQPDDAAAAAPIRQYPKTGSERWAVARMGFTDPETETPDGIPGTNALYRTRALRDIGGWDAERYPFAHEDLDLSRRLRERWTLRRVEETHVVHEPHRGMDAMRQLWRWHSPPENSNRLKRLGQHCVKGPYYALQDCRRGEWGLVPYDLFVALAHLYFETQDVRAGMRGRLSWRPAASTSAD